MVCKAPGLGHASTKPFELCHCDGPSQAMTSVLLGVGGWAGFGSDLPLSLF